MDDRITNKTNSIIALLEEAHPGSQFKVREDVGYFFDSDSPCIRRTVAISDLAMDRLEIDFIKCHILSIVPDMTTQTPEQDECIWLYSDSA
ncbi:hypothetical protein [Dongshaea marina]|uniref:hypothetical protein n=1 Tax=Dongshaea marina TaxID=2047966 RepID=UPI000D3ECCBE|nr:hypothetical protein [Dongshaea marina]